MSDPVCVGAWWRIAVLAALVGAMACDRSTDYDLSPLTGGRPAAGKLAIRRYGCGACHTIPGVAGANGSVGPPLAGIGTRAYIAGVLPNNPDNMLRWLMDPPAIDAKTAMPNVGVSNAAARDIASYLYELK